MDDAESQTTPLVLAAQGGDRAALEGLFVRYLPRVRQIVALRLGYSLDDFSTLEDLVQESLLNVFVNLEKFEERSEGRFRNWLATCVANTIKSHFRKAAAKKRSETLPFFPYASANPVESILARDCSSPSEVAEATELADRIEEVLLNMKESHREVIILSHLCGMSPRDVALVMGFTNETAVRKALSRAMGELRNLIGRTT